MEKVVPLKKMSPSSNVRIGPFNVKLVSLNHSIPEPNGLIIRTKVGTLVHTGDWKFDKDPVIGQACDEEITQTW